MLSGVQFLSMDSVCTFSSVSSLIEMTGIAAVVPDSFPYFNRKISSLHPVRQILADQKRRFLHWKEFRPKDPDPTSNIPNASFSQSSFTHKKKLYLPLVMHSCE